MTTWTAPDVASIRGDNSRPLQKIFGSLTEYLKDSVSGTTEVSQTYVRNGETTALTIGTVVYLSGQQGDRATVKRAYNTSDATSAKTLGVVAEFIAPNADGLVTTLGYMQKVNTAGFTAGQTVYLGATAGTFTATKPVAPNHMVYVGVVVRANAGNGILYVRCQNGYELDEIHDVLITSPTAGQTLSYDAVNSLWKNATFTDGGGLTNLNASNLASGTVPAGRMTGSYTGITGVGTLTVGSVPVSLVTGLAASATTDTTNANNITSGLIASARISGSYTGITGLGTISGQLTASKFVTNNASPSLELGAWSASPTWSAVQGYNGYLLMGNTSDRGVYLRSFTSTPVRIGALESNALIVNASSSYTSVECDGGYKTSGTFGGYQFASRNTGDVYTWYSNNGDGFLYSSYFNDNVIGVARTTGITYLYRGVTGNVQNGSYGSMSMYGENNGYVGINFPGQATTWMSATNGQIFGCYRNNTTWNFYVSNGTFVPSDERYKRDIKPLTNGMAFMRGIVPVTYDPLTEDPNDDPETTVGRTHYGFTTQNILKALELSGETRDVAVVDVGGPDTTTGGDRQYLNHSALIAPMVKAIQELDARLQQLETV